MLSNLPGNLGAMYEAEVYDPLSRQLLAEMATRPVHIPKGATRKAIRQGLVEGAAPYIARLVTRDLESNPRSRQLIVQSYLTAKDPMREFQEVAAHDYMLAVQTAYPDAAGHVWVPFDDEEEDEESPLLGLTASVTEMDAEEDDEWVGVGDLGKFRFTKRMRRSLKKVGKVVAISSAVVGTVALTVVTGGAALPLIAQAGTQAWQLQQQKKAAEYAEKEMAIEEAELAAEIAAMEAAGEVGPPGAGEFGPTTNGAIQGVAEGSDDPNVQGNADAQGDMVNSVIPQSMASYAAGQVSGMSPADVQNTFNVSPGNIQGGRLEQAEAVARGATPSKGGLPGWAVPAAAAGGALVIALATGAI